MKKILKKIAIFTIIILLLGIGGIAYLLSLKPVMISPFSYSVEKINLLGINEAEKADILIVGDRLGANLNNYLDGLKFDLKEEFKRELKIYNWSVDGEGLHRTLHKIKALKKLPPLILYHGGSQEWIEKKFNPNDKERILFNFKMFHDEKIISLIITFPDLSRLFYKPVTHYPLLNLRPSKTSYTDTNFDKKEIEYLYYQEEMHEFLDYIKQKKSSPILLTTPINILIPPREACSNTSTNMIVEIQQEIEGLITEGNFKMAYSKAIELEKESLSNAKTFFLLGISAKANNDLKVAKDALTRANVYDCFNWRGNSVFNSILKKKAHDFQVEVIDFDLITSNSILAGEEVFFDEIYPQNLYYSNLMKDLAIVLKKYLNINEHKN